VDRLHRIDPYKRNLGVDGTPDGLPKAFADLMSSTVTCLTSIIPLRSARNAWALTIAKRNRGAACEDTYIV
jgi:hypothetical protein